MNIFLVSFLKYFLMSEEFVECYPFLSLNLLVWFQSLVKPCEHSPQSFTQRSTRYSAELCNIPKLKRLKINISAALLRSINVVCVACNLS